MGCWAARVAIDLPGESGRHQAEAFVSAANHVGKREVLTRPDAGDV